MLAEGVPFQEAIDFLKERLRLPEAVFQSLLREMDAAAQSRSRAMSEAMYRDLLGEVLKALENGTAYGAFKDSFDAIAARHGWKGEDEAGWRSRLIFRVATAQAQAAGEWRTIQRFKTTRPWLRYVAVLDDRTRHEHRDWHGVVLHCDDPWWDTHFPPNGFNCRCSVQQLSDRNLKRYGYEVSPAAPERRIEIRQTVVDGVRRMVETPRGIDPGFAVNVGKAGLKLPGGPPRPGPASRSASRPWAGRGFNTEVAPWREAFIREEAETMRQAGVRERDVASRLAPLERPELVEQTLADFCRRAALYVRVPDKALRQIVSDGRFKTQYETGSSRGALLLDRRKRFEEELWGFGPEAISDAERPVYGYLSVAGPDTPPMAAFYGGVAVRLKDGLKARATFTMGDSLNRNQAALARVSTGRPYSEVVNRFNRLDSLPSEMENPHALTWNGEKAEPVPGMDINDAVSEYAEFQVFGGVSIADIAEVHFEDEASLARLLGKTARKKLTDAGVALYAGGKEI